MKIFYATLFFALLPVLTSAQREPKVKEINYHFEYKSIDFIGEYDGEVLKVEIDGKTKKGPHGVGVFKGKHQGHTDHDVWLFYSGAWLNGKLDGKGTMYTLNSPKGIEPNWIELEKKLIDEINFPVDNLTEHIVGKFSKNALNGDSCKIICPSFSYYGEVSNWLPNGTGVKSFSENIRISDQLFLIKKFEGQFTNGQPSIGSMTLVNGDKLNGDWSNLEFTGQGTIHYKDTVYLMSSPYETVKFEGAIVKNEFENGSMYLKNNNVLKGNWYKNSYNGSGNLNIQDTLFIASSIYPNSVYDGKFIDGQAEIGTMTLYTQEKLSGNWTNLSFTGNDTLLILDTIFLANTPFQSLTYIGNFVNSQLSQGVIIFHSGQKLTGDWTNQKYTGAGSLDFNDILSYSGEFVNGNLTGKGILSKRGAYEYRGTFSENRTDGFGTFKLENNWIYEGIFSGHLNNGDIQFSSVGTYKRISPKGMVMEGSDQGNKFIGQGEMELSGKSIYNGTFTLEGNKVVEGNGKLTFPDGDVLIVSWDKDGYTGTGRRNYGVNESGDSLYEFGTFKNGVLHGQGKKVFMFKFMNDLGLEDTYYSIYEGEFQNGAMNGKGKLNCVNPGIQHIFEGDWSNNTILKGTVYSMFGNANEQTYTGDLLNFKANGNGKLERAEETYTGSFKQGLPSGKGKFVFKDGSFYEGDVFLGVPNGKGTMTLKNKQVLSGNFKNGEFQKPFTCKEVKIGNQVWMAENLNVERFRNGDLIPEAKSKEEWINAGKNSQPAWCYYNNDSSNGPSFGKLYNYFAVIDSRGLAPEGWHVPSEYEFQNLNDYLGETLAGKKMKSTRMWGNNGSNESGFSALPSGYRENGLFFNLFTATGWWSITNGVFNTLSPSIHSLTDSRDSGFYVVSPRLEDGHSVRCVKN